MDMTRPFEKGRLFALVSPVDHSRIRRIVRVVEDLGEPNKVTVENDSVIEGDAAIEYDFPTPEPLTMDVDAKHLRPIIE